MPTTEKINEAKNIDLKSNFFGNFFQNIFLYGNSFITFFFVKHEKSLFLVVYFDGIVDIS